MATRAEAEAVLRKKAEALRKAGAHALHVDSGQGTACVACHRGVGAEGFSGQFARECDRDSRWKKVTVAVKTKPSEPFKAEKL
jgi:hypothetical protein